jgi:hypothetical protein
VAEDIAPLYELLEEFQIRLLKIHPGESGDGFKTFLITVGLEDAPPYEALSYV